MELKQASVAVPVDGDKEEWKKAVGVVKRRSHRSLEPRGPQSLACSG